MLKIPKVEDLNQISANSITKSLDFSQKSNFCKSNRMNFSSQNFQKIAQLDKTYGCLIGALRIGDCDGGLVTVGRTTG